MIRSKLVYLAAAIIGFGTLLATVIRFQLKRHAPPVEA